MASVPLLLTWTIFTIILAEFAMDRVLRRGNHCQAAQCTAL